MATKQNSNSEEKKTSTAKSTAKSGTSKTTAAKTTAKSTTAKTAASKTSAASKSTGTKTAAKTTAKTTASKTAGTKTTAKSTTAKSAASTTKATASKTTAKTSAAKTTSKTAAKTTASKTSAATAAKTSAKPRTRTVKAEENNTFVSENLVSQTTGNDEIFQENAISQKDLEMIEKTLQPSDEALSETSTNDTKSVEKEDPTIHAEEKAATIAHDAMADAKVKSESDTYFTAARKGAYTIPGERTMEREKKITQELFNMNREIAEKHNRKFYSIIGVLCVVILAALILIGVLFARGCSSSTKTDAGQETSLEVPQHRD